MLSFTNLSFLLVTILWQSLAPSSPKIRVPIWLKPTIRRNCKTLLIAIKRSQSSTTSKRKTLNQRLKQKLAITIWPELYSVRLRKKLTAKSFRRCRSINRANTVTQLWIYSKLAFHNLLPSRCSISNLCNSNLPSKIWATSRCSQSKLLIKRDLLHLLLHRWQQFPRTWLLVKNLNNE